jgi:hypothetical protein
MSWRSAAVSLLGDGTEIAHRGDPDRTDGKVDGYALVRSATETKRLILQERLIGSSTERLLLSAGIQAGMRVR